MGSMNVKIYSKVLNFLENSGRLSPDRLLTLNDIEMAFRFSSDMTRANTIKPHIDALCQARLLFKRGEVTYFLPENWKAVLISLGGNP